MNQAVPQTSEHLIQFYPTCGWLSPGGDYWQLSVRGRVVRPRPDNLRKRVLIGVLRRALDVAPEELESPIFATRVADFLMLGLRDRNISVDVAEQRYPLKKASKTSGYFSGSIRVPSTGLAGQEFGGLDHPDVRFTVLPLTHGDPRTNSETSSAMLVPPVGPSVITDIDDTLKVTEAANTKALMANTFLRPFQSIDGMAELYRGWSQRGTAFHYVSASPWPLYRPLSAFLFEQGFPIGSFHLRNIKIQGTGPLKLLVGSKQGKRKTIRSILRWYPHRQFVLIGDSDERDPEIYGWIARRFPRQVIKIYIRHVSPIKRKRLKRAFRKLPASLWSVFETVEDLHELTPITHVGWDRH